MLAAYASAIGLRNPGAAVARGLEMLALPSQGCLARVGCECNVISGVSVQLHKPPRSTALHKQTLALSLLSAHMGPASNTCCQAKDTSLPVQDSPPAFTLSEHTCKGACVEMGGEGRQ